MITFDITLWKRLAADRALTVTLLCLSIAVVRGDGRESSVRIAAFDTCCAALS
jgi:hypothetical protein